MWDPAGRYVATSGKDGLISFINVSNFQHQFSMSDSLGDDVSPALSLDFNNTGSLLASGHHNSTVKVWDVSKRKVISSLQGFKTRVNSVSWDKDSRFLAAGSSLGKISVYNPVPGSTSAP